MSHDADWNPYAGGQQAADSREGLRTTVPHTLGILNIIFGVVLLLCLACYGMQIAVHGLLGTAMAGNQQLQQAMEEERQKQLDDFEESAENAATEEEAEDFLAQRDNLQNTPLPQFPDMSNMTGMKSPGVLVSYIFDCLTGLVLNVMMVISGIGLLKYREWARKLALWVAGLKILRLLIVAGLTVAVIAPGVSNGLGQFVGEAAKMNPQGQQPPQMQVDQVKMVYYWSVAIWGVVLLVLGAIYPLVSLRMLTRPQVVSACQEATSTYV